MLSILTGTGVTNAFGGLEFDAIMGAVALIGAVILIGLLSLILKCYKKVNQGTALIRNGMGGTKVSFSGMMVFPVIHRMEQMEISVKRVEIDRMGQNGLICKDNMRADVKVAFFVQVNKTPHDALKVAQSLGCRRASDPGALIEFFDAKFSEALKTVGKQFDFVELYNNRQRFKEEIIKVIGTDLNGYVLDDAAIDYLEQTNIKHLDPNNILDADGIKKITDLTARQAILANEIERDKEKTIKKQDVDARETILQLEKQQAEAEKKQAREIAEITARQTAEAEQVRQQERLKAERARITSDEEIAVAEENRLRQVIVAAKNKERTAAVETERVEKDRALEATERERTVTLAQIEKEKAVEVEKRNIQEVIRERVNVERSVVEQEEKIKDTKDFAAAERSKRVALTLAEEQAEQEKIKVVKLAEASKDAAELAAKEQVIAAEGHRASSEKEADARKIIADATAQEEAVKGFGEARALEAKADAEEKYGLAEAKVIESKAVAEAKGKEAHALAIEKQGAAEATVMQLKYQAEAKGIEEKAASMKVFDDVGKSHEEFKLNLQKQKDIELAQIGIQTDIARAQAEVVGEALKHAHIDIVGGETAFFDKIVSSVTAGKAMDRIVDNSDLLTDVRYSVLGDKTQSLVNRLRDVVAKSGIESGDLKNLSVAALLSKMIMRADDDSTITMLGRLQDTAEALGIGNKNAAALMKDTKN
jgi:flotillin